MSVIQKTIKEEVLIELLLARQPSAKGTVELLRRHFAGRGGYGAFAPITGDGCGACRVTIATAKLQRAMKGAFITCANCARFLYLANKL